MLTLFYYLQNEFTINVIFPIQIVSPKLKETPTEQKSLRLLFAFAKAFRDHY
jgi:hypothetical protein